MAQGRPYQAYQNTSIQTSGQQQLIVMLYEGMNRFMTKAVQAIKVEDHESAHNNLNKTGKILLELLSTLREDKGGEVAANLKKIYVFCYEQVVVANLKKDIQQIEAVRQILNNLSEGWKDLAKQKGSASSPMVQGQSVRITG